MHYETRQLSIGAYTMINDDPNYDMELYSRRLELYDGW
jgi:hypothetical protein